MPGRSPDEAVDRYMEGLQQALSCVTKAVLRASGRDPSDQPHALALNDDFPARIPGCASHYVCVQQKYRIIKASGPSGRWKVCTAAYHYQLRDDQKNEILAYHWHPDGATLMAEPHLHLKRAKQKIGRAKLGEIHIPTGRVVLEDFLQLLIEVVGVQPIRKDWKRVLRETRGLFREWKTW